jgi:hypothetical protein
MATLSSLIQKFQKISVAAVIQKTFDETADSYADLQIEQFAAGERKDGSKLPNYSPTSVSVYGKLPGPWTLYDTGDFYRGRYAKLKGKVIEIGSTDNKEPLLAKKAGPNLLGLQKDNIKEFTFTVFKPAFFKNLGL